MDGARALWVAAVLVDGATGAELDWRVGDAAAVLGLVTTCDAVGVDIPIGFLRTGRRPAEQAARAILGPARSSIFLTPPLPAFGVARALGTGREVRPVAQDASRAAGGTGISTQAWSLVPKILAVEDAVRAEVDGARAFETHPETAFRLLSAETGTDAPLPGKRSAAGQRYRARLLSDALGLDLERLLLGSIPPRVTLDDALDAVAAAWSARRRVDGRAVVLGAGSEAVWSDGTPAERRGVIVV